MISSHQQHFIGKGMRDVAAQIHEYTHGLVHVVQDPTGHSINVWAEYEGLKAKGTGVLGTEGTITRTPLGHGKLESVLLTYPPSTAPYTFAVSLMSAEIMLIVTGKYTKAGIWQLDIAKTELT